MKRPPLFFAFLFLILLSAPARAFSDPACPNRLLYRKAYTLCYDPSTKNASWVSYELKDSFLVKNAERANDFKPDPELPPGTRQELSDYKGTDYDRGHLAPANDMTRAPQIMSESFLLSNMTPQYYKFNRGIWKQLETDVRKWAKKKKALQIYTGPLYLSGNPTFIGKDHIVVPTHFYKIIVDEKDPKDSIAFIIPNKEIPSENLPDYIVSIDDIEKDSGIDFLGELEDNEEAVIEAKKEEDLWTS